MDYNFKELITGIRTGKHKLLGTGSSRRVYDLDNGFVIKIARDIRGIHQNKNEHKIYSESKSNFFAEVVAVSEEYRCLIMPKAGRIKTVETVCRYYNVKNIGSLLHGQLASDIKNGNLSKPDLIRPSSWGLVNDVPLIIDYGLTHEIYRKYYGLNKLFKKFKPLRYS